jgi:hypothetical protein
MVRSDPLARIWALAFDHPIEPWPTDAAWKEHVQRRAAEVRSTGTTALILPKPWWLPKPCWYWLVAQILVIVEPPDA